MNDDYPDDDDEREGWDERRDRADERREKRRAHAEAIFEKAWCDAERLLKENPERKPVIIEGLLRKGEVLTIIAPPKVGKSWLVQSLAVTVAVGKPLDGWLGMATPCRMDISGSHPDIMLIDGELHRETLADRLRTTKHLLGVGDWYIGDHLSTCALRGKGLTIDDLALVGPPFDLIIIDPLYRFLPPGVEENSNAAMARVYNRLAEIAERSDAAIVVVHHTTKGNQSDKGITDVGAGAGSQSRATDNLMILREHEEEGAFVVEAVVRSFDPLPPFVIRWKGPGWERAPDLDPSRLKRASRRGRAAKPEATERDERRKSRRSWTPDGFAERVVGRHGLIRDELIARATELGIGKADAEALLKRAEAAGKVRRYREGPNSPNRYTIAPPETSPAARGGGSSPPPAPGVSTPGGVGGKDTPPSPLIPETSLTETPRTGDRKETPDHREPNRGEALSRLLEWIEGEGGSSTAAKVAKGVWTYRGDTAKADADLQALVDAGRGRWDSDGQGGKGGRPTRRFRRIPETPLPETPAEGGDARGAR